MSRCYIAGIGSVTFQGVWTTNIFDNPVEVKQSLAYADQPSYKELIPPAMARRMSKGVKMGIYASQQALDDAQVVEVDAIITGTGLGCLEDSEKFLKAVLDNGEEFLTPTSFIQSTHNTVGAQIALRLGCKAYNFTYVNGGVSFESAILDGLLQLEHNEIEKALIGGIDEISGHTFVLKQLTKEVKADGCEETIANSTHPGVNFGEGSTFFVLSYQLSKTSYAELIDVKIVHEIEISQVPDLVLDFLKQHNLSLNDIDVCVLGVNGDLEFDTYYAVFENLFDQACHVYYKHLVGHSDIAGSFGLAAASYILKNQFVPSSLIRSGTKPSVIKNVLLYNQHRGKDHSLTLLRHVEA